MTWDQLYNLLGIKEFIYFISSSQLQDTLFPVKLIFALFTAVFLYYVIYFMITSSYLKYKFLEDVTEFISWRSYGARELFKRWDKIKKRIAAWQEADFKLAIIDADDFLAEVLEERGFAGKTIDDAIEKAGKVIAPSLDDVKRAHEVRNSIVYNPEFRLTEETGKKTIEVYEKAINSIGL